jgi:alkylhydroperoxidase family enzyme
MIVPVVVIGMAVRGISLAVLRGCASDRYGKKSLGSDRDIWDIASVAAFHKMSNRLAAAVEMAPNPAYHGTAR